MFEEADLVKLREAFLRAAESPLADQIVTEKLTVNGRPGTKRNLLLGLAEDPELVHYHKTLIGIVTDQELEADKPIELTADEYVMRLATLYPHS